MSCINRSLVISVGRTSELVILYYLTPLGQTKTKWGNKIEGPSYDLCCKMCLHMEQCLVIIDVDLSPGADPGLFKGGGSRLGLPA